MFWRGLISLATPLFACELLEPFKRASMLSRMAVSGELVRIDYNFNGGATIQDDLAHLLTREIEPFIDEVHLPIVEIKLNLHTGIFRLKFGDHRREVRMRK